MSMIIDPPKNTSVMRLGTTLKKTISQPFLGQQILVTSQNKKCAALLGILLTSSILGGGLEQFPARTASMSSSPSLNGGGVPSTPVIMMYV